MYDDDDDDDEIFLYFGIKRTKVARQLGLLVAGRCWYLDIHSVYAATMMMMIMENLETFGDSCFAPFGQVASLNTATRSIRLC